MGEALFAHFVVSERGKGGGGGGGRAVDTVVNERNDRKGLVHRVCCE